jgi:hypothetical protein
MSLNITHNSLLKKHYLLVDSTGVEFYASSPGGEPRQFTFSQMEQVLMSPEHVLSFQAGDEVFSIPTNPDNAEDQAAIEMLVQEARRAAAMAI